MAPIGPRLDRPSAVGDEGRPRATSLGLASTLVLALSIAVGFALGEPGFFTGFALLAGLAVAGAALLDRDRLRQAVVGHLCFLPAASTLVVVAALSSGHPLLVGGVVAALLGTGGAWADVGDADHLKTTLADSVLSYAFGLVLLVATGVLLLAALAVRALATGLAGGTGPVASLLGVLVLVGIVCACLLLGLWSAPIVELSPRDSEAAVERRLGLIRRRLVQIGTGSTIAAACGAILAATGVLQPVATLWPVRTALDAITSLVFVAPLVAVGVLSLLVAGFAVGVRRATAEYSAVSARAIAAGLGAVGYLAILLVITVSAGFLWNLGAILLIFSAVLLPMLVYLVLLAAFVVVRVGLVTDRAAPITLASAGLVSTGVGAASEGLPALVVFGAVAGALVVWDVGTFGLGVAAELGHRPETRRLELYHGVFAVGIGLGGVVLVTGVDAARRSLVTGFGAPEAMAVAVVGVVILLLPLRG